MPTSFRQLRNRIIGAISPVAAAASAREDCDVEEPDDEEDREGNGKEDGLDEAKEHNGDEVDKDEDMPTSSSPSRVILDLIDSTCHEIIALGGDMNSIDGDTEFVMPSFESYVAIAKRLDYYMDLLIKGYPNAEEPKLVLEQGTDIWFRFVMAKWIIDVCTKVAYPDDYVDVFRNGHKEPRPPALMDTSWDQIRHELAELSSMLDGRNGPEMGWKRVQSLECAMEGLGALAKLRSQLSDVLDEIESGNNRKKSVSAFNFGRVIKFEEQYRAAADKITKRLEQSGSAEYYANLFLSLAEFQREINAEQRPSTIAEWKNTIYDLLEEIEQAIADAEFPLDKFKTDLLDMLKDWEVSYLPEPALFKVGYFKYGEGDRESNGGGAALGGKRERKEPNRFTPSSPTKKSAAAAASSPAKSRSPIKKRTGRRGCRVPFTDVEKECLLKGVAKYGVGHWADILQHYSEIFEVANRNNVDLKDLYRNLKKAT